LHQNHVELAPAFGGDAALQEQFLGEVGTEWPTLWTLRDTQAAHDLWTAYIQQKHDGHVARRPVTDVLIEAFARRFQGLIARNAKAFYDGASNRSVTLAGGRRQAPFGNFFRHF